MSVPATPFDDKKTQKGAIKETNTQIELEQVQMFLKNKRKEKKRI